MQYAYYIIVANNQYTVIEQLSHNTTCSMKVQKYGYTQEIMYN